MRTIKANDLVDLVLKENNKQLADYFSSDVLMLKSPIRFGLDDFVRIEVENLYENEADRPKKLTVLLETTGGYIEVVERIYNVFRRHYEHVEFVVPNYAYSAGTVLVLSGDEIYMDYYSVVGPIDPQMENENERFVTGLGYLAKFEELVETINGSSSPDAVRAELAYLLKKFDPAELFDLEQAKNHSEDLLEEWLSKHKFRDWNKTETNGVTVDDDYRKARARQIAEILGNPKRWHSHGRGIGIKELTSEEIKLKITDFGADPKLNELLRNYYDLFIDYCGKMGCNNMQSTVIHSRSGVRRV